MDENLKDKVGVRFLTMTKDKKVKKILSEYNIAVTWNDDKKSGEVTLNPKAPRTITEIPDPYILGRQADERTGQSIDSRNNVINQQAKLPAINFVGFLSNTDDSILKVPFDHGFQARKILYDEANRIVKLIENTDNTKLVDQRLLSTGAKNMDEENNLFYIIRNQERLEGFGFNPSKFAKFHKEMILDYLEKYLSMIRLYKGNMQLCLYCIEYNGIREIRGNKYPFHTRFSDHKLYMQPEKFTLTKSELSELVNFLAATKMPFKEKPLQLALKHFDRSFGTEINSSFLSLLISLECMFNDSEGEIAHKLARGVAMLAGNSLEESRKLYEKIKAFYKKRNNLIHSGLSRVLPEDIYELRKSVRACIAVYLKTGKNKNTMLNDICMSGGRDKVFLD